MRLISAWLSVAVGFWTAACVEQAFAWEVGAPPPQSVAGFVGEARPLDLSARWSVGPDETAPLGQFALAPSNRTFMSADRTPTEYSDGARNFEFSLSARTIVPSLQIGVAQRAAVEDDADAVRFLGREFRLGDLGVGEFRSPTWDNPQWYVFAATDDGALTYTPAARREGVERWRVQEDRMMVGDFQAGVSVEASGVQAALSYVQRKAGAFGKEEDASFTGFSLTWRR